MSFTFDTTNNIGSVRALCYDIVEEGSILSDEMINVYLTQTEQDVLMAASLGCSAIACSKALIAKKVKAGHYSEDTTTVAREYSNLAGQYRDMSNNVPAEAAAEIIATTFNYNEILTNKVLRGENV